MVVLTDSEIGFLRQARDYLRIPDDYIVADLETSGFSRDRDFIIEVAIGRVQNRQLVSRQCAVLNWLGHETVDRDYIASQLARIGEAYAAKGRSWRYTPEVLQLEGQDPLQVLHTYMTCIRDALTDGQLICGHGFWQFDRSMLDVHCDRFLPGFVLPWHSDAILDTGLIAKTIQLAKLPWAGESRDAWFNRIAATRAKGVMWSLDGYCLKKYELESRYQIEPQQFHTAGFDILAIHLLVETYRHLVETV